MEQHDWTAIVRAHARRTGAHDLPPHAIDELAVHLEDLYAESRRNGSSSNRNVEPRFRSFSEIVDRFADELWDGGRSPHRAKSRRGTEVVVTGAPRKRLVG